ncbi:hypothetical protein QQ056_17465 [Oscillatoria laete-virens NRMC-F 0139]|nr:hypothetical protein [Oscillatoria laete-virens]MDL5055323.1 hypothetical protein [Oscillatoria laete-virens NRMC-F 0139]
MRRHSHADRCRQPDLYRRQPGRWRQRLHDRSHRRVERRGARQPDEHDQPTHSGRRHHGCACHSRDLHRCTADGDAAGGLERGIQLPDAAGNTAVRG